MTADHCLVDISWLSSSNQNILLHASPSGNLSEQIAWCGCGINHPIERTSNKNLLHRDKSELATSIQSVAGPGLS